MTTERPHYLPPSSVRPDADREPEIHAPQPRTASSATTTTSATGGNLSRSTSATSRSRSRTGHAPRSPSGYSTTFTLPSVSTPGVSPYSASSPPPQGSSSTHAGGILPAASFFHPSRPNYYTDFSPSASFSTSAGAGPGAPPIPLAALQRATALAHGESRPESTGSDSFVHSVITTDEYTASSSRERSGSTSNNATLGPNTSSLGRSFSTKVSREPLLPIGPKPKPSVPGLQSRPSVNGTNNSSATRLPGAGVYNRWGEASTSKDDVGSNNTAPTTGRARTSLEKFLRRNASNDAQMASDITFTKNPKFSPSLEDLEARPRDFEEPFVEFKAAPGVALDDGETLDITRNANSNVFSSMSRRQRSVKTINRFRNFNPIPPASEHPMSRVPLLDPNGKPMRKYELHPSRNSFFLKGKILTGGDSTWPFLCSVILVLGLTGTWLGTTAVWWWKNESPAVAIIGAYMCLLSIANMAATAFSDPGILPRNLDPDPPYPQNSSFNEPMQAPLPRDLKVRSGVVRVKYCQTCRIYRPPRSSHCRMCDNCVDGCDHHCQWVNNCVGRRNYTSFILFLTFGTLTLCLFICTSAIHLVLQAHKEHIRAAETLREGAGSAVVFVLCVIVIWPVSGLLAYHMRLLFLNLTTIEQIRNSAHKSLNEPTPPNPFGFGSWRRNLAYMLCRSRGMSWLSASEVATEDKRDPNPGSEVKEGETKN